MGWLMKFLGRIGKIFDRAAKTAHQTIELTLPAQETAHEAHQRALRESRRQTDGTYHFGLQVTQMKDGSYLLSSERPLRMTIGLPADASLNIAPLVCAGAAIAAENDLKLNLKPLIYIVDPANRQLIEQEHEETPLIAGKQYVLVISPQGALPDFEIAYASAGKPPVPAAKPSL